MQACIYVVSYIYIYTHTQCIYIEGGGEGERERKRWVAVRKMGGEGRTCKLKSVTNILIQAYTSLKMY